MGFLSERRVAKLDGHTVEVRGDNRILRGLVYGLFFDGEQVAEGQNFWKVPTRRSLEARVSVDGAVRHLIVSVEQKWLSTGYALTIDGEAVPLEPAK
jgi:hypothetical protein